MINTLAYYGTELVAENFEHIYSLVCNLYHLRVLWIIFPLNALAQRLENPEKSFQKQTL